MKHRRIPFRLLFFSSLGVLLVLFLLSIWVDAANKIDIVGPEGSNSFGHYVKALPNGNIVVVDPDYRDGVNSKVGAVFLYDGSNGELISVLTGSTTNDQVGYYFGITVLANGNFLVFSPTWDNGAVEDAGAVTWVDGTTGLNGVVSPTNSLVGSAAYDQVGFSGEYSGVWILSNGNYLVQSNYWDNGTVVDAGAVTWGNGMTGITGTVSSENSLVGSTNNDSIGNRIWTLTNGNFVVESPYWDNGPIQDVGAVTWGNGMTGINGVVSSANSLVGSTAHDHVGNGGVEALTNGNFVVISSFWDNGPIVNAGAITWGNGSTGINGIVSSTNSLIGSAANDEVGSEGVTALKNGNYVVRNSWIGAVTLCASDGSTVGPITEYNSVLGDGGLSGFHMSATYDYKNDQLVVGRPAEDIVTLFHPDYPLHLLTVLKAGQGTGTVRSSPLGIDCGIICGTNVSDNSTITLMAAPDLGFVFAGWSGAGCTGADPCILMMDEPKEVTATFAHATNTIFLPIISH